jgi:hypothetical protein
MLIVSLAVSVRAVSLSTLQISAIPMIVAIGFIGMLFLIQRSGPKQEVLIATTPELVASRWRRFYWCIGAVFAISLGLLAAVWSWRYGAI